MRKLLVTLCMLGVVLVGFAQVRTPEPMRPARLVNDFAGLFSPNQIRALEDSLVRFERATSNQVAVVTMNDLDGYEPSEMAAGLIDNWGIGDGERDNGIVILLKPRNSSKGEVFIGVGSGLEGALNDAKAGRVIDQVMMGDLRRGDYFAATYKGAITIMGIIRGEYEGKFEGDGALDQWTQFVTIGLFILMFLVVFSRKSRGNNDPNNGNNGGGGGDMGLPWWLIMGSMGSGRGGSGGFGSGSGSGGFGVGGFGGFGGGGSFGGGAGRDF